MGIVHLLIESTRAVTKFLLSKPVKWGADHLTSAPKRENVHASLTELYGEIKTGNEKKGHLFTFRPDEQSVVIFSDQHKGARDGSDDFMPCEENFLAALDYYETKKFYYLNLGDSEELWENNILAVLKHNGNVFEKEKAFVDRKAFYKVFGNHDLFWDNDPFAPLYLKKMYGQAIHIHAGVVLRVLLPGKTVDIFCTHGHQGDAQSDGNAFSKWFVSYIWGPLQAFLQLNTNTPATNNALKSLHNQYMYEWSARQENVILITGHTHQPVFKSLTHLERLYQERELAEQRGNEAALASLDREIPLRKKETGEAITSYRNIDPTYFNAGCCCFADGDITGIEIELGFIRLIKWSKIDGGAPTRIVLEEERLSKLIPDSELRITD